MASSWISGDPVEEATSLTDEELGVIEARAKAANPGPWKAFVEGRDHFSGDDFIRIGGPVSPGLKIPR